MKGGLGGVLAVALVWGCVVRSAWGSADLGLGKTAAPEPVRIGKDLTFRLVVTNRGPQTATNTLVTDVLPDSLAFVSCSVSQGSWTNESGTIFANLGNLAAGSTASVTIVVRPQQQGVITNQASATANNANGVRASAVSTVRPANRPPIIALPGPHVVVLGASTSFVVSATDPDHDPVVTITNTVKPSGAVFNGTQFSWTAARAFWNTTNKIEFVANDHQNEDNSIVTNSTSIMVPRDGDGDGMDDGWEWDTFGATLARNGTGDYDGDGMSDYAEYIAGTQPTNATSVFRIRVEVGTPSSTTRQVRVTTQPGRFYTVYWRDSLSTGSWMTFASTNAGSWWETSPVPTNYAFVDDEGAHTTGGSPTSGRRIYKVRVTRP